MTIPQIGRHFTTSAVSSISTNECVKVINDVLPKVETFGPNKEKIENDKDFFRETILPIFLQRLYKEWPDAYKLIMRVPFKIKIIHYEDNNTFNFPNLGERAAACYGGYNNDEKAFNLSINLYDYHKIAHASRIYTAIQHEIMHLISHLCYIALNEDEHVEEKQNLAFYIDKKCDNILADAAAAYRKRFETAKGQLWQALVSYGNNPKKFYDEYDRIMQENHCWTYALMPRHAYSVNKTKCDIPFFMPLNSEEFLALGLQMFFGSNKQKRLLFEQDKILYDFIETFVLKLVKKITNQKKIKN